MNFSPINVAPLQRVVVEEIESKILTGELSVGKKLPPEAELAKKLGVGRRAVREALHILQNRGLVEVCQGIGSFVRRNDLDSYLDALSSNVSSYLYANKGKLENVLEFREVLETYGLRRICETGDRESIQSLRRNLEHQRRASLTNNSELYNTMHLEFHRIIILGLNNPIISMVYEQILNLIAEKIHNYANVPGQMEKSIAEHDEIVKCLEQRNVGQCFAAMKTHLSLAYENLKRA
jgi:DNA-binding FadR family transcriptional regulator